MDSLNSTAADALRHLMADQPTSAAKIAFAWRMAAGASLGRATETIWRDDGVLIVRAKTEVWKREVRRAEPMLLARVRELVGADVVRRLVVIE